jgi:hypothetical protein
MNQFISLAAVVSLALTFVDGPALAQTRPQDQTTRTPASPGQVASPTAPVVEADARETREQLRELLSRYPPDLGRILKMDPTMLQNQAYLAQYPGLAAFLAAHPAVVHNPGYFLEFVRQSYDYTEPADPKRQAIDMWRNVLDGVAVFTVMVFVGGLFAWLVRTVLDHRRWLRVSRVQTEVHNKLLDRFAGTGELLAYVQTPAGQKFLEAAPIPLDPGSRGIAAPLGRILWSVQVGVVLVIGGLGFQFVSGRVIQEVAEGLWMIGVLAVAFGLGFVLSGVVSYALSRRLGLLEPTTPLATPERGNTTSA